MSVEIKKNQSLPAIFSKRLIELRQKKHMTQIDLCLKVEVTQTYISALERGERSPSFELLGRLAKALGVEAGELLSGPI